MTSRTGPLSDEAILAHCQRYRPIPLGAAQHILMKDLKPQHEHAFGSKPLKYHTIMARPKDFDTLARAITKMSGNPMVREELIAAYSKDLQSVPSNGNGSNGNGSNFSDLSDNELDEVATNFPFETPHFTSPTTPQDNADLRSNPLTTRKMSHATPDSVKVHPRGSGFRTPPTNMPDTLHLEAASRTFLERAEDDVRIEEKTASPGMKFPLLGSPLDLGSGFPEKYRGRNLPLGYTRERLLMEEMGITHRLHGEGSSSKDLVEN